MSFAPIPQVCLSAAELYVGYPFLWTLVTDGVVVVMGTLSTTRDPTVSITRTRSILLAAPPPILRGHRLLLDPFACYEQLIAKAHMRLLWAFGMTACTVSPDAPRRRMPRPACLSSTFSSGRMAKNHCRTLGSGLQRRNRGSTTVASKSTGENERGPVHAV